MQWTTFPLLIVILLTGSAYLQAQSPAPHASSDARTVVCGQIREVTAPNLMIRFYRDNISLEELIFEIPIQEEGRFHFPFLLSAPAEVFLLYRNESLKLYIEPGDSLFFRFQARQFPQDLWVSGRGGLHNHFLYQFQKVFSDFDPLTEMLFRAAGRPLAFRQRMDREYRRRLNFLRQYPAEERAGFSDRFRAYLQAEIDYWYAYHLLFFDQGNGKEQGKVTGATADPLYFSFLDDLLVNNTAALTNRYYLDFLDQYLAFTKRYMEVQPEQVFEVTAPSMVILTAPEHGDMAGVARRGDCLKFLDERSTTRGRIQLNGQWVEDYWYKVEIPGSTVGWISGAGGFFRRQIAEPLATTGHFPHLGRYLRGSVFYWAVARKLYQRFSAGEKGPLLEDQLALFTDTAPQETCIRYLTGLWQAQQGEGSGSGSFTWMQPLSSEPGLEQVGPATAAILSPRPKNEPGLVPKGTPEVEQIKEVPATAGPPAFLQGASPREEIPPPQPARTAWVRAFFTTSPELELVLFEDPVLFSEERIRLEGDLPGEVRASAELGSLRTGYLTVDGRKHQVVLEPEATLGISAHPSGRVFFSGKGSGINNYFVAREEQFDRLSTRAKAGIEALGPMAFRALQDSIKSVRLKWLERYRREYELRDSHYSLAKADILFWYANELMNYPWEHPLYHGMEAPMEVPEAYYDFLRDFPFSLEEAWHLPVFGYFLDQYFSREKKPGEQPGETLLRSRLDGRSYYYYRARQLALACRRGTALEKEAAINAFLEECPYPEVSAAVGRAFREALGLERGADAPAFQLWDPDGRLVALRELQGKIVHIDFWATWCRQCIFKMENSRLWRQKLNPEKVIFAYISLDQDTDAWRRFLETHDIPGLHLTVAAGMGFNAPVARAYKVKRLPAAFLIDAEGKVVRYPGDGGKGVSILEHIRKLLGD